MILDELVEVVAALFVVEVETEAGGGGGEEESCGESVGLLG